MKRAFTAAQVERAFDVGWLTAHLKSEGRTFAGLIFEHEDVMFVETEAEAAGGGLERRLADWPCGAIPRPRQALALLLKQTDGVTL